MASVCLNVLQFCRFRVTKLDADGGVAAGPGNSYVTESVVDFGFGPEVEAGIEETLRNGCGCITATRKDADLLKRFNLTLTGTEIEPNLLVILLGADPITSGADTVGYSIPAQIGCDVEPPAVMVEGWAKGFDGDKVDAAYPYFHIVFPMSFWQQAQNTIQNQFMQPAFSGYSGTNEEIGSGPYGDLPQAIPDDSLYMAFFTATAPPAASCSSGTVST